MKILHLAGAIALACLLALVAVSPATAQSWPVSASPEGWAKPVVLCSYDSATKVCTPYTASGGTGGGSGTDPRVAQGSSTPGQTGILEQCATVTGDQAYTVGTTNPLNCTTTGRLKVGVSSATNVAPAAAPGTTIAADLTACRYLATPPTWSDTWTGALQCDNTGALRMRIDKGTDSAGRLMPGQGIVTSTRTALTASTPTSISTAAAGRVGLTVQVEAALTAPLYLCTSQAGSCSATSYDALIPSGSGAGTAYTFLFAPNSALYAFSTGTPTLVANSWTAQ